MKRGHRLARLGISAVRMPTHRPQAVRRGLSLRWFLLTIDVPLSVQIPYRYELDFQTHMFATSAAQSLVAQSASTLIPDPGAPMGRSLPTSPIH
jgi:hypothetical protein